jgi:hypothetical protein
MGNTDKPHFPWKTTILCLTLLSVIIIGATTIIEACSKFKTGRITNTFVSDIPVIISTHGKVLELATTENTEFFEKKDAWYLGGAYLGENVARIRVPTTYRYHLLLSDPWELAARNNVCIVRAPMFKPSQPPAIHTDRMEKEAEGGWARFDKQQTLDALEHELTPNLKTRASDSRHVELVREHCRNSVAEFVKEWLITRAQWTNRFDSIVVVFPDERTLNSDKELEHYDGKPTIQIKK